MAHCPRRYVTPSNEVAPGVSRMPPKREAQAVQHDPSQRTCFPVWNWWNLFWSRQSRRKDAHDSDVACGGGLPDLAPQSCSDLQANVQDLQKKLTEAHNESEQWQVVYEAKLARVSQANMILQTRADELFEGASEAAAVRARLSQECADKDKLILRLEQKVQNLVREATETQNLFDEAKLKWSASMHSKDSHIEWLEKDLGIARESEQQLQQDIGEKDFQIQNLQHVSQTAKTWKLSFFILVGLVAFGRLWFSGIPSAMQGAVATSVSVQAFVQHDIRSDSGHRLPVGETPSSSLSFLNEYSQSQYMQYPAPGGGPLVYVTLAESTRINEDGLLLDSSQLDQVGKVDAFIFVWSTSSTMCVESDLTRKHRQYINGKFGKDVAIAFLCHWKAYWATPFVKASLQELDKALLRVSSSRASSTTEL